MLGAGVVVVDPLDEPVLEPMLPELGRVVVEPLVEPEAPLPALPLVRCSSWHLVSSAPTRPMHLDKSVLPEAPVPALPDVPVDELPEVDGLPDADGVDEELPDAPVLPEGELDDCANAPAEKASSAAAVAAVMVFNVIFGSPGEW